MKPALVKTSKKEHFFYIDVLNIIAIVGVIFLHHNFGAERYDGSGRWVLDVISKCIFRYAVPVFLMISGATLLCYRQKYDTKTFFKKRFSKLVIPSLFWIAFMYFWCTFIWAEPSFQDFSLTNIAKNILENAENANYWFIFLIIGIYLTLPALSFVSERRNKKILLYIIAVMFIFNSIIPAACSLISLPHNQYLSVNISPYFIYIFIGYYLHAFEISKRGRIAIYSSSVLALLLSIVLTICFSNSSGSFYGLFSENTGPLSVIYSSGVFLFIKTSCGAKGYKLPSAIPKLASCSFGIYLSHLLVMHYEKAFLQTVPHVSLHSWIYRFLCPFLTYALCVGLVLVLKKIPFLRRIVP